GKVSLTVVVPVELDSPAFATVILYCPVPPAVNVPCATFVTDRSNVLVSGGAGAVNGPLFWQLGLAHSLGLLTEATLLPSGFGALAAMFTSSSNMLLPPDGIEFGLLQLTLGTTPVHVQPAPEPALT